MYCMEVLEKNIDWLVKKLEPYKGTSRLQASVNA